MPSGQPNILEVSLCMAKKLPVLVLPLRLVYMYTVEPLAMYSPNSEKPLIFLCTIAYCLYNTSQPRKPPKNEKNRLLQYFLYSEVPLYKHSCRALRKSGCKPGTTLGTIMQVIHTVFHRKLDLLLTHMIIALPFYAYGAISITTRAGFGNGVCVYNT